MPRVVPRSAAAAAYSNASRDCSATASTKTDARTTATLTRNIRTRRVSHVSSAAIVPACQSAPTDDAPITSPSTIRMNDEPFKTLASSASRSDLYT